MPCTSQPTPLHPRVPQKQTLRQGLGHRWLVWEMSPETQMDEKFRERGKREMVLISTAGKMG